MPQPKLVFFFDEAHTLFDDTSKALVDKIEQVVRLIRSKGVGVYFVTQNPSDIPDSIASQLGNRVLHALRAYTPKEQKTVRAAAETFRPNPAFRTEDIITTLQTGEALVSLLDDSGAPSVVQHAKILFPLSQIGAITDSQRMSIVQSNGVLAKYDTPVDNVSAYEMLSETEDGDTHGEQEHAERKTEKGSKGTAKQQKGILGKVGKAVFTAVTATFATAVGTAVSDKVAGKKTKSRTSTTQKVVKSATSAATRTITRDILGNIKNMI